MSGPVPEGRERAGGTAALDPAEAPEREPVPTLADYDDGPAARATRFWSARRIPATVVSLIVLGASGLLLYDIAAVRAGHEAMSWRRQLARQLERQPLDRTWVLAAAALAMALGLWLLALALTPGLRRLLPMRREFTHVRAGLDREAAELALRDRAMEVSGVRSARVRMRRSRVRVRVQSHFRPLDDVRADLERALGDGVRGLGLDRRPALTVRVRRPARKG
ncbi:DUF6286 domain-containing protein [Streptomyces paludis]|uniref:DUF6286 domain-containing protein n=1 Tax=Streptomyces paludis TaxID=2282738 RepID=UPI001E3CFD6F|nr:DUF6286 domain-containing protein [Streptomyces paludis]